MTTTLRTTIEQHTGTDEQGRRWTRAHEVVTDGRDHGLTSDDGELLQRLHAGYVALALLDADERAVAQARLDELAGAPGADAEDHAALLERVVREARAESSYSLTSAKGSREVRGSLSDAIGAARAMDAELQPALGVAIETASGETLATVDEGRLSV